MNKNTYTTVKLDKGEMNIYNFNNIKLHAYKTNDFIDDEVFIIDTKLETEFHKIQDVKEDMMSELHTQTESDFYKEAVTWKI